MSAQDPQPSAIPIYSGVSEVAGKYAAFILDLWGVIHDGVSVFPGVIDCFARLREREKRIVVVSNAPRRANVIMKQLEGYGLARDLYDGLVSSGQETHDRLSRRDDPWYAALGRRCYHIGPSSDDDMLELGLEIATDPGDADFILNTGPWREGETVADYEDVLRAGASRSLPMICSNPDIEVIRGGKRMVCAGALARRYEKLGGEVRYHGKPHPAIYERCFEVLGIAAKRRILAVGDSLRTDIAGAEAAGIDSLLVTGGLHRKEMKLAPGEIPRREILAALCAREGHWPSGAIPCFRW